MSDLISVDASEAGLALSLHGNWITADAARVDEAVRAVAIVDHRRADPAPRAEIASAGITRLDTAGAWMLLKLTERLRQAGYQVTESGLNPDYHSLVAEIRRHEIPQEFIKRRDNALVKIMEDLGKGVIGSMETTGALLSFLGLILSRLFGAFTHPKRLRKAAILHQMEVVGIRATPIVGLISFLIGAVLVNQGAVSLRQFGAEIFVVDMLVISHLRELGILLTAIIIAGRSGSAFTAQIGSMILHEEVDAMQTIGINPIDALVIPRVVALVIMLPLLAFVADILGLIGGGLMAWATLDISPVTFVIRANDAIELTTFMIGIIKAPFFAAVIAISGCFEGLVVERTAESVGAHTTKAVVQSIFLVIVLDAFFAVFFSIIGW